MKATYDARTDTLSIILKSDAAVAESDEDKPSVILDYDEDGNLVSLEILDAPGIPTTVPERSLYRIALMGSMPRELVTPPRVSLSATIFAFFSASSRAAVAPAFPNPWTATRVWWGARPKCSSAASERSSWSVENSGSGRVSITSDSRSALGVRSPKRTVTR